jgi:MerR family transcriptional regulator, redox-sensitive transcriptional activator SoxR
MRIGQLAQLCGLRPSAIRYYEAAGLLDPPPRVSACRDYPREAVSRLQIVRAAQKAGFKVAEIREFVSALKSNRKASRGWPVMAGRKLKELDANIARLQAARRTLASAIDCSCTGVAERCKLVGSFLPDDRQAPTRKKQNSTPHLSA